MINNIEKRTITLVANRIRLGKSAARVLHSVGGMKI